MGGDGGVVATNRRYMRGAGSACHTADSKRASSSSIAEAERESMLEIMKTCAITGNPLNYAEDIVVCPYGKLYGKEAAVKALLRRIETEKQNNGNHYNHHEQKVDLGWHIRGLKDLQPVRFHFASSTGKDEIKKTPICPITSIELNGLQPAFLIVKKKIKKKKKGTKIDDRDKDENGQPNVLSEKAIKTMGIEALQEEYGPFEKDDLIRLAPPPLVLDEIKLKLEEKRMNEEETKVDKTSKKKRKMKSDKKEQSLVEAKEDTSLSKKVKMTSPTIISKSNKTSDDVRNNVAAAVASSSALSSLFADTQSKLSDKQKKDSLFSCNC